MSSRRSSRHCPVSALNIHKDMEEKKDHIILLMLEDKKFLQIHVEKKEAPYIQEIIHFLPSREQSGAVRGCVG